MKLLSPKQVAKIINRSPVTLYRWWKIYKIFPMPIIYNNKAIAWDEAVVKQWLESNQNSH